MAGTLPGFSGIFTNPTEWIKRTAAEEKYNLFFTTSMVNSTDLYQNGSATSLDVLLGVVSILGRCIVDITCTLNDTCIFVHVWTLWSLVYKEKALWKKRIQDDDTFTWKNVCLRVDSICEFSELVNNAISTQVAMFIAEGSLFYTIAISEVLLPESQDYWIYFCISCIFFWLILVLAADLKSQFRKFLREMSIYAFRKGIPKDEGTTEYLDIMEDCVGIQGAGRYTVDLAFFGTVRSNVTCKFVCDIQLIITLK